MAIDALRQEFPVLQRGAYLNSGTCGPLATATIDAIKEQLDFGFDHGRGMPYYMQMFEFATRARAAWGRLFNAPVEEIALTVGASDGISRALALIDWQPGDLILTSDQEHPGVLGPLGSLVLRYGVQVREVPINELPEAAASSGARLIVCSHITWATGEEIALGAIGAAGIPIVVDAAQSAGAIAVDLNSLRQHGIVAYASAGQKWTCGPVGSRGPMPAGSTRRRSAPRCSPVRQLRSSCSSHSAGRACLPPRSTAPKRWRPGCATPA
jgi:L-cysteine/cystine lyase